jgi:hypothetical protein
MYIKNTITELQIKLSVKFATARLHYVKHVKTVIIVVVAPDL